MLTMLLAKHSVWSGLLGPSVFPEIGVKGHWKCALLALLFFLGKYVFRGQCLEWLGQPFLALFSWSLVP